MVVYQKFLVTHDLERLTTWKFDIVDPKIGQYSKVASLERAHKKQEINCECCRSVELKILM